jgi:hypothetical protein
MRSNSSTVLRIQGSQPLPVNECLLSVRNIFVPNIQDVSDKVILHDADGQNTIQFSWDEWVQALHEGDSYGWDPTGTNPPSRPPVAILDFAPPPLERWEAWEQEHREAWSGTYFSCDYQEVTWDDACALADALESALADLEDDKFKEKVKQFISFCWHSGGFTIGRFDEEYRPQESWIDNDKMRTAFH